jgi:hypothetical protein
MRATRSPTIKEGAFGMPGIVDPSREAVHWRDNQLLRRKKLEVLRQMDVRSLHVRHQSKFRRSTRPKRSQRSWRV